MNVAPQTHPLRQRRNGAYVSIPHGECVESDASYPSSPLGSLPSNAFAASYVLFLIVGVLCVWLPPTSTTSVDSVTIPSDAKCLRASRHADFVSVELAIGSPGRRINVLVRFDQVVSQSQNALRIFESKVLESKSIQCSGIGSNCTDAVLLTDAQQTIGFKRSVSQFAYTAEAVESSIAKTYLRMEGELKLTQGHEYWLTSSHLCLRQTEEAVDTDQPSTSTRMLGDVISGTTVVNDSELAKVSILKQSFARQATVEFLCELDQVYFLPVLANIDQLYLSISDYSFYTSEPDAIQMRRNMVEVGQTCASRLPKEKYGSDYELYILDCGAAGTCASVPSLPFRRISAMDMYMRVDASNKFEARFQTDNVLTTLPGLSDTGEAITLAVAKLILIIVAASLVWVRADRATSKPHWQYKHCLKMVNCEATHRKELTSRSLVEDMVMGLGCIFARFAIAFWRYEQLSEDSQGRACVFEIVASALSFIHWCFRYFVISPSIFELAAGFKDPNGPLTRLGGSSAILDVTGSVLLAFSEPPTLVSTLSRFEPTARILICMLVVMVSIPRCLFSISCCTLLYESGREGKLDTSAIYLTILLAAAAFWAFQLVTLSVTLSDLVISPFTISVSRTTVGQTFWVRLCLFLGAVNIGLPRLTSSIVKLKMMST